MCTSEAQILDMLCVFSVLGDRSEQTKAPKVSGYDYMSHYEMKMKAIANIMISNEIPKKVRL